MMFRNLSLGLSSSSTSKEMFVVWIIGLRVVLLPGFGGAGSSPDSESVSSSPRLSMSFSLDLPLDGLPCELRCILLFVPSLLALTVWVFELPWFPSLPSAV